MITALAFLLRLFLFARRDHEEHGPRTMRRATLRRFFAALCVLATLPILLGASGDGCGPNNPWNTTAPGPGAAVPMVPNLMQAAVLCALPGSALAPDTYAVTYLGTGFVPYGSLTFVCAVTTTGCECGDGTHEVPAAIPAAGMAGQPSDLGASQVSMCVEMAVRQALGFSPSISVDAVCTFASVYQDIGGASTPNAARDHGGEI